MTRTTSRAVVSCVTRTCRSTVLSPSASASVCTISTAGHKHEATVRSVHGDCSNKKNTSHPPNETVGLEGYTTSQTSKTAMTLMTNNALNHLIHSQRPQPKRYLLDITMAKHYNKELWRDLEISDRKSWWRTKRLRQQRSSCSCEHGATEISESSGEAQPDASQGIEPNRSRKSAEETSNMLGDCVNLSRQKILLETVVTNTRICSPARPKCTPHVPRTAARGRCGVALDNWQQYAVQKKWQS